MIALFCSLAGLSPQQTDCALLAAGLLLLLAFYLNRGLLQEGESE